MNIGKAIALCIIGTMALGVAACGGDSSTGPEAGTPGSSSVESTRHPDMRNVPMS